MNELLVMRHGQAPWGQTDDFHRTLSNHGHAQAQAAANWLADNNEQPSMLLVSPLIRAQQTAQPIAECFHFQLSAYDFLTPDSDPAEVVIQVEREVGRQNQAERSNTRVMLVSHQPLVGKLCAWLTGERPENFEPATLVLLRSEVWAQGSAERVWTRHSNDYNQRF